MGFLKVHRDIPCFRHEIFTAAAVAHVFHRLAELDLGRSPGHTAITGDKIPRGRGELSAAALVPGPPQCPPQARKYQLIAIADREASSCAGLTSPTNASTCEAAAWLWSDPLSAVSCFLSARPPSVEPDSRSRVAGNPRGQGLKVFSC